jgi:4-amino-4-deoxy-L-arabinose transferase-like glycosyltransferase
MPDFLRHRLFNGPTGPAPLLALVLFALFLLVGLFDHDPWKVEDATHFGVVWSMLEHGDWLAPRLAGELWPKAPLPYWLAALSASIGGLLGVAAHEATRLASSINALLSGLFLALAARELYGRERAIAAPLALAGCLGLLVHVHETQPAIAILAGQSAALWGLSLLPRRPTLGGVVHGLALAAIALSGGLAALPLTVLPLLVSLVLAPQPGRAWRGILLGLPGAAIATVWPLTLILYAPSAFDAWWTAELAQLDHSGSGRRFLAFGGLLPWFAWPALPLAAWTLWLRRRDLLALPQALPLLAFVGAWLTVAVIYDARSVGALPLLPPLALLAAGGIGDLRRGAANGFDWFAMLTFTLLGGLIWLGWTAMVFGLPAGIAHNFAKLEPGFSAQLSWPAVLFAAAASIGWLYLIFTSPRSNYRGLVHWLAGMTLVWLLTASLWFPWIDYGKTYRPLANNLAKQLHSLNIDGCVAGAGLAEAQRASFDYFADLRTVPLDSAAAHRCHWLLTQSTSRHDEFSPGRGNWKKIWEGNRPGDKSEKFRLYRRAD